MKNDFIKEIFARKKERLDLARQQMTLDELKAKMQGLTPCRDFIAAINKPRVISLIAEIKRASPSRGVIRENFNLQEIAGIYKEAGVQAVSVLTEEDYFSGSLTDLTQARAIVDVPVLRKDFILEPYQVYESRLYGADAILLIADFLTKDTLSELGEIAKGLGMSCLVEAHTEKDLKKVLNMDFPLIGINNRDLHTLEVDIKTPEKLYLMIPKGKTVVVESGLKAKQDVLFLKILGINAVLIGSAFMESPDIKQRIEEIMGW